VSEPKRNSKAKTVTSAGSATRGKGKRAISSASAERFISRYRLVSIFALLTLSALAGALILPKFTAPAQIDDGPTPAGPVKVTPDYSGFNAANIISDNKLYGAPNMNAEDIDNFINKVNAGCVNSADGTTCISKARFETKGFDPTTACPLGMNPAKNLTAGEVIYRVSVACNINPRVLLVLLQKEQGLLTASGEKLTASRYEWAAGYGCPDGQTCDSRYRGFVSQLYQAAAQLQKYRLNPASYRVQARKPVRIAYNPQASCGSSIITPANTATAALYNYTPYQPNEAAKNDGDDCSSWGNLNFYGFWKVWFGAPH
jgi:hypothetical protein avisC_04429